MAKAAKIAGGEKGRAVRYGKARLTPSEGEARSEDSDNAKERPRYTIMAKRARV
jgi:hypothetical protein